MNGGALQPARGEEQSPRGAAWQEPAAASPQGGLAGTTAALAPGLQPVTDPEQQDPDKNPRLRERKGCVQGHAADRQQGRD